MAQFTRLDPTQIAAIAERYDLDIVGVKPLAAGTINSNSLVESSRGRLFLRVNEGAGEPDVAWEAALVAFLADGGVATPRPLKARDGKAYADVGGLLVTVFPWIDDAVHHEPPAPADCRAVGVALRRFHEVGAAFPDRRESRYAKARIVERAEALARTPEAPAAVVADLRRELDALSAWHPPDDGIVHGDLFPDNVLFSAAGATLLDFEQASVGSFVYDVAVVLLSWCWDGRDFDGEKVRALLDGYGPIDEDALRTACRFGAVRFSVTRLTDVELDPRVSPEIRAIKDYREYVARLAVLRR